MKYNEEKEFIISEIKKAYEMYANNNYNITQKTQFDLVTDIDLNIEKSLSKAINDKFPGDKILGEEFSFDEPIIGRTWTIDPIDGTCNMARGLKLYGVQCSLIENEEIVLGVIYLPHFNEIIYAIKNEGCYINDEKINVNSLVTLNNAIVSFGDYPHKATSEIADLQHSVIKSLYSIIAKIRMFGAACIDFSSVALGRTDACVVITKNLWDICPGIILCKEAGAIIKNLDGDEFKLGDDGVIASANIELSNLICNSFKKKLNFKINNIDYEFDGIIFDFDGVVMDTEKYHFNAWNKALSHYNMSITMDEYLPFKSTGREKTIEAIQILKKIRLNKEDVKNVSDLKGEYYNEIKDELNDSDFINGVLEFLDYLYKIKIPLAVASSGVTTNDVINKFKIDKYFMEVIDGNTKLPKKPNPDIFIHSANLINCNNCLVFEDSLVGIEAAYKAGMKVIAIGGIKSDKAILCIDDFKDILKYIK